MTTNNTSPDDTDLTRRSLEECTPGEWRVEDDGDLYIVTGVDRDVARVDVGDEHTATPRQIADAWLMAQGKAHAAEVLRLRMELHGAQHALEEASRERVRASLRADAAEREVAALRAIVAGRTVPPTDAEIAAHEAAGGLWWVIVRTESLDEHPVVYDTASARALAAYQRNADPEAAPIRWWALSRNRIPCAWPVVDGVSR